MQENKKKLIGLVVIALLAIAATGGAIALNSKSEKSVTMSDSTTKKTNQSSTPSQSSSYKDGEYSASGSYVSPGGDETIGVKLTLTSNAISSIEIETHGVAEAAQYQSMFKDGIASAVVGKKVDEISVSRVSGSSLTSAGFNNALTDIKNQAKG